MVFIGYISFCACCPVCPMILQEMTHLFSELQIRGVAEDNSKIIFLISQ